MQSVWKRENFIAILGFYGGTALVDKRIKKQVRSCSVSDLLRKKMYRESVCAAFFDGDGTEKKVVCVHFFGDADADKVDERFAMLLLEFGVYEEVLSLPPKMKFI